MSLCKLLSVCNLGVVSAEINDGCILRGLSFMYVRILHVKVFMRISM